MSDINWKNEKVCYADGVQWNNYGYRFSCVEGASFMYGDAEYLIGNKDFQLNEIREGDFIPASELDTEQKYNDVVEVFGLFGFSFEVNDDEFVSYSYIIDEKCKSLKVNSDGYLVSGYAGKRQLTYHQIIAIGKLKRIMLERAVPAVEFGAVADNGNTDQVKNPSHYQLIEGVESIEIIARSMTKEQWKGFCLGNMLKYRIRAGKKDALQQDIEKANFYGDLYEMHKEKCYD